MSSLANMKQNIGIQALEQKKTQSLHKEKLQNAKWHKHAQKCKKHTRMIMEFEIIKSDLRP